jgi:hypothetical protein
MTSIFSQLPNDLIMMIIRQTKTSLDFKEEHEDKFFECLSIIEDVGECKMLQPSPEPGLYFCVLTYKKKLTNAVVKYILDKRELERKVSYNQRLLREAKQ